MGIYRLALAICVLLYHAGVFFWGQNQGVVAVISFFLLSGFVMTALIRRNYLSPEKIPAFYLDRALRLFPQYLLYLVLTLLLVAIAPPVDPSLQGLTPFKAFLNALMLPLAGYMLGLSDALLIPQAWSLGLESTFYLIIPWLLVYRFERIAFVCSVCVFVVAYLGFVNTDIFGYRLLPGTLFIFLCGSFLYQTKGKWETVALRAAYVVALALFLLLISTRYFHFPFNREVLAGFLVGLPIVAVLARCKAHALDTTFGNLSYGVFLNHFFLIFVFQNFGIATATGRGALMLVAASIGLAWLTFQLVERPTLALRHGLRRNADPVTVLTRNENVVDCTPAR